MKRKLALFLALVMIISLVPANVFAETSNRIDRVPSVSDDYAGFVATGLDNPTSTSLITLTAREAAPLLIIEEEDDAEFSATETFRLELINADWKSYSEHNLNTYVNGVSAAPNTDSYDIKFDKLTSKIMEVEIYNYLDGGSNETAKVEVRIPMYAEVDGEGDIQVKVDSRDSHISGGTYTFATASTGDTDAKTEDEDDPDTFGDTIKIDAIEIEELKIATLGHGTAAKEGIVLKLPKGFKWDTAWSEGTGTVEYSGFNDDRATNGPQDGDFSIKVDTDDSKKLYVVTDNIDKDLSTKRGSIFVKGLKIVAESSAPYGEVKVKVYGDKVTAGTYVATQENVTSEYVTIAKYVNYEVVAEADSDEEDLPTIYAGDYEGATAEENEIDKLIIKEEIASSWLTERRTRIEFPSWVKILDVDVKKSQNFATTITDADFDDYTGATSNSENYVEISGADKSSPTATTKFEAVFYVSIKADEVGDVVATVSGTALTEDQEVKLATAVAPITVDTSVEEVRIGLQDQAVGTITVTEAADEILEKDTILKIWMEDDIEFASTPTVTVTEGDLELKEDDIEINNNVLSIPIKSESTEASTIEITGVEVDLNRSVAEGDFVLKVGGTAVVKNDKDTGLALSKGGFDQDHVVEATYIRVITPTDYDVKSIETVVFTIDSSEYKVGETVVTMDAAPFIDAANRTMLPLRAFANALGVTDNDIVWNGTERSVTIFKGDAVVKVVIGQMSFMKNGVNVPMDTMAIIKDGRTFLPVRALGQALGAEIGWDATTRSVTIK